MPADRGLTQRRLDQRDIAKPIAFAWDERGRCFVAEARDYPHDIEENGQGAGDQVYESNGVKLLVDPISVRYLGGAEVDFVDTITGGGFTIKNPNATSTCGCGSSFSVE